MNNTGIYRIQIADYFYFGQSSDLERRKSNHLYYLRKGEHKNPKMQAVYNKYQDFSFSPLVYAEIKELNHIEQGLLDVYWGNKLCMNIAKDASAPARGLKRSEETRRKMSEAKKGEKHFRYGKKLPEEHKRKMSESSKDKTLYNFIHDEHGEVTCTKWELYTKYNLDQSHTAKVALGRVKTHKGWRLK